MNVIRVTNYNCGFGKTLIEFTGPYCAEHCATYLAGRSSNKHWDRPYLGDYSIAQEYLKEHLKESTTLKINLCMGGGSMPDYEYIEVTAI